MLLRIMALIRAFRPAENIMSNPTPTLEESIKEINKRCVDVCTNMERAKATLKKRQDRPSIDAITTLTSLQLLINQMRRTITELAVENERLRTESMNERRVKRAMAGMVFGPVSKAELN
jgi:hypothetical protein